MICPETNEEVRKVYCESFVEGRGCKHINVCKEYQVVKDKPSEPIILFEDTIPEE